MKLEADALDHAGSANYAHRPLLSTHQTSALMSKKERRQTQSKRQKNAAAATATSAVEWQANKIKRYNAHTQCNAVAVDSEHCCRMKSHVGIVHPRFDIVLFVPLRMRRGNTFCRVSLSVVFVL